MVWRRDKNAAAKLSGYIGYNVYSRHYGSNGHENHNGYIATTTTNDNVVKNTNDSSDRKQKQQQPPS